MLFYLIRHAHAVDLTSDHERPLSDRGREQVTILAKFLRRTGDFTPDEIWHSPLVRARETAELLTKGVDFDGPCRETPGLQPEDDPRKIAQKLANSDRSIAVVGHEPHLSALASLLVVGAAMPPVFSMKKGATLALERAGKIWIVRWHVAPAFLG